MRTLTKAAAMVLAVFIAVAASAHPAASNHQGTTLSGMPGQAMRNEPMTTAVVQTPQASQNPWLPPIVGALGTVLGVVIATIFATRNTKAGIVQKANELETMSIDERLKNFIGPFQQLSAENFILSREMKRKQGTDSFRTLPALLTPGWHGELAPGDSKLLAVIVGNGLELRDMILKNSGATSSALLPYFAAASTHFRLLYLAQEGSLEMDPARFEGYVYPRQLDSVLELERQRLERRRELLRSQPNIAHRAMPELVIPMSDRLPATTDSATAAVDPILPTAAQTGA